MEEAVDITYLAQKEFVDSVYLAQKKEYHQSPISVDDRLLNDIKSQIESRKNKKMILFTLPTVIDNIEVSTKQKLNVLTQIQYIFAEKSLDRFSSL